MSAKGARKGEGWFKVEGIGPGRRWITIVMAEKIDFRAHGYHNLEPEGQGGS
jgi:hypothetical protein